jgi:hypothetical protein
MGDDDKTLDKIRRRWTEANFLLVWQQIPRPRRERVLAELEESARELAHSDRQLAADLTVALDVLDDDNAHLLDFVKQAQADIHELLTHLAAAKSPD